jgi:uncharacterized protein (DUF4415 family)
MKEPDIRHYTATELRAMRARGESLSDWEAVRNKTEAELEADIASDPDWKDVPVDWIDSAVMVMPVAKKLLSLRLDREVVAWFRAQGPGYQTKINAVLRAYVEHERAAKKG